VVQPRLLAKLLWRVIIPTCSANTQTGDSSSQRLDTVLDSELVTRAKKFVPGNDNTEVWSFNPIPTAPCGWISSPISVTASTRTYAIASLLAQETLTVDGHLTHPRPTAGDGRRRGLPHASPKMYQKQLRDPI